MGYESRRPPRLRILPLPAETIGEFTATPYLAVVDLARGTWLESARMTDELSRIKEEIGAKAVLVFADEIDLDGAEIRDRTEELTDLAEGPAASPETTEVEALVARMRVHGLRIQPAEVESALAILRAANILGGEAQQLVAGFLLAGGHPMSGRFPLCSLDGVFIGWEAVSDLLRAGVESFATQQGRDHQLTNLVGTSNIRFATLLVNEWKDS